MSARQCMHRAILVVSLLVAAAMTLPESAFAAAILTVDNYLNQVKEGNASFQAAARSADSAVRKLDEGSLLVSPQVFANVQLVSDQSYHPLQGAQLVADTYTLGIQEQTAFGLSAKLYYTTAYSAAFGVNPAFANLLGSTQYYDSRPVLELTLPLWRNFMGAETRSLLAANRAANEAGTALGKLQMKQIAAQAELAYWRLGLSREAGRVQRETYERSLRMRDLAGRRARSGLGERSDLLQAEAVLKLRKIELEAAADEERSAARDFNSVRGIVNETVPETLEGISRIVNGLAPWAPDRTAPREDVVAAQAQARAAVEQARATIERNRPTVEAFGSLATNGHGDDLGTSAAGSVTSQSPTATAGLRVNIPLNIGLLSDVRRGYEEDIQAADLRSERKAFESEAEWRDLLRRRDEAERRLALAREVEAVQREKVDLERERHRRGKTTTFIVLQFEQDYYVAQLTRLRVEGELLGVASQMKTFAPSAPSVP